MALSFAFGIVSGEDGNIVNRTVSPIIIVFALILLFGVGGYALYSLSMFYGDFVASRTIKTPIAAPPPAGE